MVKQLRKEGYELVKKGSSGTAAPDSSFDDQELDEESSTNDEEKMEQEGLSRQPPNLQPSKQRGWLRSMGMLALPMPIVR